MYYCKNKSITFKMISPFNVIVINNSVILRFLHVLHNSIFHEILPILITLRGVDIQLFFLNCVSFANVGKYLVALLLTVHTF